MKLLPLLSLLLSGLLSLGFSCNKESQNPIEKTWPVTGFNGITGGEQLRFTISAGTLFSVRATGEARDISELVVQKTGSQLVFSYDRFRNNRKKVYVTVTMPSLLDLSLGGQATSTVDGFTESVPVRIALSGQSRCWWISSAPRYTALAEGQSDLQLQGGTTQELALEASGQSTIHAYSLPAPVVHATTTGQSTIRTRVTRDFTADASGQSRIYYKGEPSTRIISVSGQSAVTAE